MIRDASHRVFNRQELISEAILERLAQASPVANHGCLLDACIEATEQLDRI